LARLLIVLGILLVVLGIVLFAVPSLPFLGKLPGDLRIERPGVRVYIPIATSFLVSLVLSGILWLVSKLR
jgi:hypothetical protein